MEYLCGFVLDGLDLDLVGRVLPLPVPNRLLQPQDGVHGYGMSPGALKLGQVLHEVLGAGEQPGGQPHELPSPLFRQPVPVLRQLLHHLTVNLVSKYLLKLRFIKKSLKYSRAKLMILSVCHQDSGYLVSILHA